MAKATTLNRRRGTSNGSGVAASAPLKSMLFWMVVLAVSLCLGMFGAFYYYSINNSSSDVSKRQLPGVPNLFRGNIPQVPHPSDLLSSRIEKLHQGRDKLRDEEDHRHAHLRHQDESGDRIDKNNHPAAAEIELDLKPYDTPPTNEYPYDLTETPSDYAVHNYEPKGGMRFSEYTTGGTPYKVSSQTLEQSHAVARSRRKHVKSTMQFVWSMYVQHAFGSDELLPQSGHGSDNWGGQGITLVDALDTLWLMDMKDEFYQARDWVRDHLSHTRVGAVSVFETTIRDLGGLLSAYDWSGDATFLEHALDLGDRLLHAFDGSSTGIPFGQVNLGSGQANNIGWTGGNAIISEFGTLQIENRYLSRVVPNRPEFAKKTEHVFEVLHDISPPNGLFPYYVQNNNRDRKPVFTNDKITFGAMADSLYEYMLKIWIQGGKTEPMYREMYDLAIDSMHKELLQVSTPSGLVYIADKNNGHLDHKMDHLVCFMGGLLALGAYTDPLGLDSERAQRDLRTGKALTYTCYQMYARMNTGISAEFVQFYAGQDFQIGRGAPHYLLRPEAVESFFILNQLTGDPVYREWGWEVWQSIEKYCRTEFGYGSLSSVQDTHGRPRDKMESFFLAETLKYLYLLQDPDTPVDILHKHVFNTEAHPLRIFPVLEQEMKAAAR